MTEPATSTTVRCQSGYRQNARSSSAGRDLLERGHPDDLDEAAGRDRLDAVLGLAATERPQGRAEAGEVLGGLHAEPLGGQQVAGLVQA